MNHQNLTLLLLITANNSDSLKYNIKLLGKVTEFAGDAGGVRRLNVKVVVPLKYLSNFSDH